LLLPLTEEQEAKLAAKQLEAGTGCQELGSVK